MWTELVFIAITEEINSWNSQLVNAENVQIILSKLATSRRCASSTLYFVPGQSSVPGARNKLSKTLAEKSDSVTARELPESLLSAAPVS